MDLLFSDLSGEPYSEIIDRPSQAAYLPALQRADSIGITVDGSLLAALEERHSAAYRARILQRALLEHGGLRPDADVDIILTKWDVVNAAGTDSTGYARALVQELADNASETHDVASFVTCGRSLADGTVATGSGLDSLVNRWCRQKKAPMFGPTGQPQSSANSTDVPEPGAVA
jgi:hypothetical protein